MIKLWQRFFILESLRFFFLFLLAIFLFFDILDFSVNGMRLLTYSRVSTLDIITYYFHYFIKFADLFLPLTMLFTVIKVLGGLNLKNELIALEVSGISKRKLTLPFFYISIALCFFSYLNHEFFYPISVKYIDNFKELHLKKNIKKKKKDLNAFLLKDHSRIVCRHLSKEGKGFYNLYWIKNKEEIWHMSELNLATLPHKAKEVHIFKKDKNDLFKETEHHPSFYFDNYSFLFEKDSGQEAFENLPLSHLFKLANKKCYSSLKEKADLLTQLNCNMARPLFSLLVVLGLTPLCLKFSRNFPIFLISAIALFFFILFYTIFDAATILSENEVLPAPIIIWKPLLLSFTFLGYIYFKRTK